MTIVHDREETRRFIKDRWENSDDTEAQIASALGISRGSLNYTLLRCGVRLVKVCLGPDDELKVVRG